MEDLIDRQALRLMKTEECAGHSIEYAMGWKACIEWIRALPSAQPDIIRCKDCKHWIPYDWMFSEAWQSQNIDDYPEDEISCNYCDVHMKSSDFCSQAVRREVQDENDKTTNNTTNA